MASLFNHFYLHTKTALQFLGFGLFMLTASYGIAFLGSFVINTLRVPWLLDAESGEPIDALETRALKAENRVGDNAASKRENKQLFDLFW